MIRRPPRSTLFPFRSLTRLVIAIAVAAMAGSLWLAGHEQRDTIEQSFRQGQTAEAILTSMLDEETGLRGFVITGRDEFLSPFREGERRFGVVVAQLDR